MIDALRERVLVGLSKSRHRINKVVMTLNRLIVQNNIQASLLASGSSQLGPLGVAIAEGMAGKDFETSYDKTRPFIIAVFKGSINIDGKVRRLDIVKANNFNSAFDAEGKMAATRKSVTAMLDAMAGEVRC